MTNHTTFEATLLQLLQSPTLLRATLSGPQRLQKSPLTKITLRPLLLKSTPHLQISRFTARQDHTQNILPENLPEALADILPIGFANAHITTAEDEIDLRLTKKLALQITRKKRPAELPAEPQPHNRTKILPLPENTPDHLLQVMGIMSQDHKILPSMRSKFTQINQFLKLLDPLVAPLIASLPHSLTASPLTILDAGSGSAYLTFSAHHYLTHIKKIPAQILGIDLNDDLIQKSITRAEQLNTTNLTFTTGKIGGGVIAQQIDIVLALHACDTATDDAIAQAIHSNAKILLAAPCCHKNLNHIHIESLAPLHRHGILHQRLADLLTDSFRALILRIMGYKTDVIEFISPEHTARNLMIRAIQSPTPPHPSLIKEYLALKKLTASTPHLEPLLGPLLSARLAAIR